MAWSDPKTDWAASDAVAASDLNRIEENIEATQFQFSVAVGSSADYTITGDTILMVATVEIPDGRKLILGRLFYYFGGRAISAKVEISGEGSYTSSTGKGDVSPLTTLYSNSTGSTVEKDVLIEATVSVSNLLAREHSVSVQLYLEDV